jgi:hypothetical protein
MTKHLEDLLETSKNVVLTPEEKAQQTSQLRFTTTLQSRIRASRAKGLTRPLTALANPRLGTWVYTEINGTRNQSR